MGYGLDVIKEIRKENVPPMDYLNSQKELLKALQVDKFLNKDHVIDIWNREMSDIVANFRTAAIYIWERYKLNEDLKRMQRENRIDWFEAIFTLFSPLVFNLLLGKLFSRFIFKGFLSVSKSTRVKTLLESFDKDVNFDIHVNEIIEKEIFPLVTEAMDGAASLVQNELIDIKDSSIAQDFEVLDFIQVFQNQQTEAIKRLRNKISNDYLQGKIDEIDMCFLLQQYNDKVKSESYYSKYIKNLVDNFIEQVLSINAGFMYVFPESPEETSELRVGYYENMRFIGRLYNVFPFQYGLFSANKSHNVITTTPVNNLLVSCQMIDKITLEKYISREFEDLATQRNEFIFGAGFKAFSNTRINSPDFYRLKIVL